MKDKISQVRDFLLDRIESGEYPTGSPIPSARKLGESVDASFAMILQAVNALAGAGILHCVSRQGSVVRPDWKERLMPNHFVVFNPNVEVTTSSDDPSYFFLLWNVATILQHFLFCKW